jgi:formylmethanofuran dehydrogenase subunit E
MHRLCDQCGEYTSSIVPIDDDAYCNECYEKMEDSEMKSEEDEYDEDD